MEITNKTNNLVDLSGEELIQIGGGESVFYYIGYGIGKFYGYTTLALDAITNGYLELVDQD